MSATDQTSGCVPLQVFVEATGAVTEWQPGARRILIRYADVQVVMSPGVAAADVNGVATPMEMAPWVDDGQPYVPMRFLAEVFALAVSWDETTKTATITN